jgi:hypothetical protein
MKYERHPEEYARDFAKGHQSEQNFIDLIGLMGGSAMKIGHLPNRSFPQPRMSMPSPDGEGATFLIAPDVVLSFPCQTPILAQVKSKKLEGKVSEGSAFFYLDERELYLMQQASQFYQHVVLVVECSTLDRFIWLHVADLDPANIDLIKRQVCGKPTFLLPLHLFKPISEIKEFPNVYPLPREDRRSRKTNPHGQSGTKRDESIPRCTSVGHTSSHFVEKVPSARDNL